jgi:hypothetical protein
MEWFIALAVTAIAIWIGVRALHQRRATRTSDKGWSQAAALDSDSAARDAQEEGKPAGFPRLSKAEKGRLSAASQKYGSHRNGDVSSYDEDEQGGSSLKNITRVVTYEEPREDMREQRPMPTPGSVGGAAFEISYADADDVITERVIRVQEVRSENGLAYIDAYCFLAAAKRTFRGDRILSMKNHRTGEQIRDPRKFFAMFYDDDDELVLSHEAVMSRAKPGLQALVWVARAGGELDDAVIDIMLDYIDARRQIGSRAADLTWNRDVAKRWIMFTRPYFDNAAGALSRLSPAGRVAILTREFVERIGATSPARQKRADRLLKD